MNGWWPTEVIVTDDRFLALLKKLDQIEFSSSKVDDFEAFMAAEKLAKVGIIEMKTISNRKLVLATQVHGARFKYI